MNTYFVYGTLKKDMKNHHIMKNLNAKFIAPATTIDEYPMFDLGNGFPYVQNKPGIGHVLSGELWTVSEDKVKDLDYFEGVPTLYKKGKISVIHESGGVAVANCYFITDELDKYEITDVELLKEWSE